MEKTPSSKAKTQTGITEKNLTCIADILNTWLADEYILVTKTKNFHWNITGANFYGLHMFLKTQYEELDLHIDEIAERIRSLGHFAAGTLSDFLKMTHLTESRSGDLNAKNMLQELLQDHEIIIRWLRTQIDVVEEKYKDAGTADFMNDMMKIHEKMAWMVRSLIA